MNYMINEDVFDNYFKYRIIKEMIEINGVNFNKDNLYGVQDFKYGEYLGLKEEKSNHRVELWLKKEDGELFGLKYQNHDLLLSLRGICLIYKHYTENNEAPSIEYINSIL